MMKKLLYVTLHLPALSGTRIALIPSCTTEFKVSSQAERESACCCAAGQTSATQGFRIRVRR